MTWSYLGSWAAGGFVGLLCGVFVLRARRALTLVSFGALLIAWVGFAVGSKWQHRLEYLPPVEALSITFRELFVPGMRLPLGFLTGGVLAGVWCLLFGARWLETGDALAVAAAVLEPIGRIGCLTNSCCMGRPCGRIAFFCMRFSPDTEAYNAQIQHNLISPGAPLSLPAHPLAIYFALVSLVALAAMLALQRRRAPAGSMLATFCLLWPLAKLLLEPLRAVPRPSLMMIVVPATILAFGCALTAALWRRTAARRTGSTPVHGAEAVST